MFFGTAVANEVSEGAAGGDEVLLGVRQLEPERLVAAVATLLALALLYLVNADVDVVALEVVDIELRQLVECVELALEATGRPLLALAGETVRLSFAATYRSKLPWGLVDVSCPEAPQLPLPLEFRYGEGCLG
jgi:hypothetical protein